MNKNT